MKAHFQLQLIWRVFGLDLETQHPGRNEVSHSTGRAGVASSFYIRKLRDFPLIIERQPDMPWIKLIIW